MLVLCSVPFTVIFAPIPLDVIGGGDIVGILVSVVDVWNGYLIRVLLPEEVERLGLVQLSIPMVILVGVAGFVVFVSTG